MTRMPRSARSSSEGERRFLVDDFPIADSTTWDVFVGSLGFEERSRFFLERYGDSCPVRLVSAYNSRRVHSWRDNLDIAHLMGCNVSIESDAEFVAMIRQRLSEALGGTLDPTVLIDISSCSRTRIAALVSAVLAFDQIVADFVYTPGAYQPPSDVRTALSFTGPVTPAFVGRSPGSLDTQLTAVIGLGYESLEALGALQLLEASEVWALLPLDGPRRYSEVVREENSSLIEVIDSDHVISYDVLSALSTFELIEQLVYGSLDSSRTVIVPLGPKIFALSSLLVSARFDRAVPVWRFSSDQYGESGDVKSAGDICGLRVTVGDR